MFLIDNRVVLLHVIHMANSSSVVTVFVFCISGLNSMRHQDAVSGTQLSIQYYRSIVVVNMSINLDLFGIAS